MLSLRRIKSGSGVYYLVIIQITCFVLQNILATAAPGLVYNLIFTPGLITERYFLWQFLTANFLHANFLHLFFNLLMLYMFGPVLEDILGKRRFVKFFMLCGMGGYLIHYLFNMHSLTPVLGASGADFGLLFAFCFYYPNQLIYLFFILPMKAWHAGVLFGLVELGSTFQRIPDGTAHLVHLGGLLMAFIYLKGNPLELLASLQKKYREEDRKRRKAKLRVVRFEDLEVVEDNYDEECSDDDRNEEI